jgi:hypothetical protein
LSPLGDKRIAPEIQGVDLRDWNIDGQEYLRRRIREVTDEIARGFPWDRSRCPYPGINAFDRADAAIFFGRDIETRQLMERLEARRVQGGKRLLLVVGGERELGKGAWRNDTFTPNGGHSFVNWTQNAKVVSASATYTFAMPSANVTLTAHFK